MARYKITHQVRVLIQDEFGDIHDTYYFKSLGDAKAFMNHYPMVDGNEWSYEFVFQKGNSVETLVEESVSENGEYYENGIEVPESVKK